MSTYYDFDGVCLKLTTLLLLFMNCFNKNKIKTKACVCGKYVEWGKLNNNNNNECFCNGMCCAACNNVSYTCIHNFTSCIRVIMSLQTQHTHKIYWLSNVIWFIIAFGIELVTHWLWFIDRLNRNGCIMRHVSQTFKNEKPWNLCLKQWKKR